VLGLVYLLFVGAPKALMVIWGGLVLGVWLGIADGIAAGAGFFLGSLIWAGHLADGED
jgi:hypothetical protein